MIVDSNIMKKTGRILIAPDLGEEYGFVDINSEMNLAYFVKNIQTDLGGSVYKNNNFDHFLSGLKAPGMRNVKDLLQKAGYLKFASFVPSFLNIPYWMLSLAGSKF